MMHFVISLQAITIKHHDHKLRQQETKLPVYVTSRHDLGLDFERCTVHYDPTATPQTTGNRKCLSSIAPSGHRDSHHEIIYVSL